MLKFDQENMAMRGPDESKRTLAWLTARNVEIARLLERLRSRSLDDDTLVKESAPLQELKSNEVMITRLADDLIREQ